MVSFSFFDYCKKIEKGININTCKTEHGKLNIPGFYFFL